MSDTDEEEDLQPPTSPRNPAQPAPLPRLWKTEPESDEYDALPSGKKSSQASEDAVSRSSTPSKSKGKSKSVKEKEAPVGEKSAANKVLKEDTPTLDTYETRRRARMLVGALTVVCVLLFCWIIYTGFFYDPSPVMAAEDPITATTAPEPVLSPDGVAQFMFDRARNMAEHGHEDQAIAMLKSLIKVYKDTPTALAAKAALDRFSKNLPLFSQGPIVVAQAEEVKPPPAPKAPPTVVALKPNPPDGGAGEAALVLPSNPAEAVVVPPASPARTTTGAAAGSARTLPAGFQANLQAGIHQSGWPRVIVRS